MTAKRRKSKVTQEVDWSKVPKFIHAEEEALAKFKEEYVLNKRKRLQKEAKNLDLI